MATSKQKLPKVRTTETLPEVKGIRVVEIRYGWYIDFERDAYLNSQIKRIKGTHWVPDSRVWWVDVEQHAKVVRFMEDAAEYFAMRAALPAKPAAHSAA